MRKAPKAKGWVCLSQYTPSLPSSIAGHSQTHRPQSQHSTGPATARAQGQGGLATGSGTRARSLSSPLSAKGGGRGLLAGPNTPLFPFSLYVLHRVKSDNIFTEAGSKKMERGSFIWNEAESKWDCVIFVLLDPFCLSIRTDYMIQDMG